jgi:hypothetical protein
VLIKYDTSKTSGKFGKIAMPYASSGETTVPNDYCDITLSPYFYTINNNPYDPYVSAVSVGQTLSKIGWRTGHTYGQVVSVCDNFYFSDRNVVLYCQNYVHAYADEGDSGGPVFIPTVNSTAQAIGILWGGDSSIHEFGFSLLWYVRGELGDFAVR